MISWIKSKIMAGQEIGKTDEGGSITLSGGNADLEHISLGNKPVAIDFSNLDRFEFKNKWERETFIKKVKLIRALVDSHGIIKPACERCGVGRRTFYSYYKDDPEFRSAVDEMKDIALDDAEEALFKNIEKGYEASIIFYLKTQGKKRGYIEHKDVNHNINMNLNHLSDDELEQRIEQLKGRVSLASGEEEKAIRG